MPEAGSAAQNLGCGTRLAFSTMRYLQMKRISLAIFLMSLAMLSAGAQAPSSKDEHEQVLALAKEVQAQQSQIVANQTKIDAKLAELAELIRVARLYSSRGR